MDVAPGDAVRIVREWQGLTQSQLAGLCGIPQSTISGIETGRIKLGVERAKALAIALRCHPAALVFPGWEVPDAGSRRSARGSEAGRRHQAAARVR